MPVPEGVAPELSAPVVFWIVPPVHVGVPGAHVPPFPVTVRPPAEPVPLRTMPFAGDFAAVPAEMLRNVSPLAPIVVLVTLSAVPVVLVSVLVAPVMVSAPAPVEEMPGLAPELTVTPAKVKVAALLAPVRVAPAAPVVVSPVRVMVPPMSLSATAVPVVVATEVWATSTLVIAPAGSLRPALAPVESASALTKALLFRVAVPCTVAVPVPIVGRVIVPAGGVIPISVSKLAKPVTPCPTSHSPVLSAIPVV